MRTSQIVVGDEMPYGPTGRSVPRLPALCNILPRMTPPCGLGTDGSSWLLSGAWLGWLTSRLGLAGLAGWPGWPDWLASLGWLARLAWDLPWPVLGAPVGFVPLP